MSTTYRVKYKKLNWLFKRTIKNVKGDFIADDISTRPRILILEDETRIEIPTNDILFEFSKERFLVIKQRLENDIGQKLPLNPG